MEKYHHLTSLGLKESTFQEYEAYHEENLNKPTLFLGRVSIAHQGLYTIITEESELLAKVSGKFIHETQFKSDFPAVGDWVLIDRNNQNHGEAIIHQVLTRDSMLYRKEAGKSHELQVIASNIDTVFICTSLNQDYNLNRIERYMSLVKNSLAKPVLLLTKADLCEDIHIKLADIEINLPDIEVLAISTYEKSGFDALLPYLKEKETIAFIGSSGVGKSTLINALLHEEKFKVKSIRKDDKGKHTTTHRELMKTASGVILIDTPGMKEIALADADIDDHYEDILLLAQGCKFRNCQHQNEPNCAVKEAIKAKKLPKKRLKNYQKLLSEQQNYTEKLNHRQKEKQKTIKMLGSLDRIKKMKKHNPKYQ